MGTQGRGQHTKGSLTVGQHSCTTVYNQWKDTFVGGRVGKLVKELGQTHKDLCHMVVREP